MAGPPLVCVEIFSPGDESYEKLPFFAGLGVPEVWVVHRDTKRPTVFELREGEYHEHPADPDGWVASPATGIAFRQTPANTLATRIPGRGVFEVPTRD